MQVLTPCVFYSWGLSNCSKQKKNIKLNFIDRLIRKSLQLHRHFCLFVVCPWANSSKCGRCRKSRLLFGKPPFERCCFHVAQIALDPNPPSSVTPLKQEIARFFLQNVYSPTLNGTTRVVHVLSHCPYGFFS